MNQFKENIQVKSTTNRSFYKVFEKGKDGRKVYKGSIAQQGERYTCYCLDTVSCFLFNRKGDILVEKRTSNKNVTPGKRDVVSGHIDNNETPTQAMIREYVEELHDGSEEEKIKARNEAIENLQKLEELYLVCDNKGYYVQFYMLPTMLETMTIQGEEIEKIEWIPMEEVFEMIRQGKTGMIYDPKIEKVFQQVREFYQQMIEGKEENSGTIRCYR